MGNTKATASEAWSFVCRHHCIIEELKEAKNGQ
jgi:hypothetical protein